MMSEQSNGLKVCIQSPRRKKKWNMPPHGCVDSAKRRKGVWGEERNDTKVVNRGLAKATKILRITHDHIQLGERVLREKKIKLMVLIF